MSELDPEIPEADAAEQAAVIEEDEPDEQSVGWAPERLPDEANEADATEQRHTVPGGDDDYR